MTASAQITGPAPTRSARSPLPALAGLGAFVSLAGAVVVFGDAMSGSTTAAEAAEALTDSSATGSALLGGLYALLGIAVAGTLAARLGRVRDTGATRLIAVLGTGYLLLMALFLAAPAAAVTVGTLVLDGGVSPGGAESALVLMNVLHPVAAWTGAAFLVAVAVAARSESRPLAIASAVFAAGLLLPPVGWAVGYLMGAWFAGAGIWLWRRP
jgi:hypothetical protein